MFLMSNNSSMLLLCSFLGSKLYYLVVDSNYCIVISQHTAQYYLLNSYQVLIRSIISGTESYL